MSSTEKSLVFYLPEGFADWEGAFLMPEIRQARKSMVIVSESGGPVQSIGGLKVTPDASLASIDHKNIEGLILIGSDGWADPTLNLQALELASQLLKENVLVAAICGATSALARLNLLNDRHHTSNNLDYLKKKYPNYSGESLYSKSLAVTDGNLITASGIGPLEFTREILNYLQLFSPNHRKHWYALYKDGVMPPMEFWTEQP